MHGWPRPVADKVQGLGKRFKARAFALAESYFGIHITPVHFYSPIPTVRELDPELSTTVNPCVGMDFNVEGQLGALRELFPKYTAEYMPEPNSGLSRVDALVLYAMIRERRPDFLVEVGCGESTKVSLRAIKRNESEGSRCRMMTIDPSPPTYIEHVARHGFQLVKSKVQNVDYSLLADADILFIDSSHVAKFGSDVNYEIFNIVPRMKVGALVHWHDIMIPVDYPMSWIRKGTFWNESYMVHAFMLHNHSFRTKWAARYMQLHFPDELRGAFPYFDPSRADQQLSSFWVERIR